jgi:radical SAM superfamily enzyme YgiQ (UPF0313 family)
MLPSLYVAASMPDWVDTRIVDEDVEPVDFDIDADLVGVSFMTYNAPRAYEIADRFRNEKGKPVIVGGYHPTLMPDEASRHADAVCVGDAEQNVPRMMEDFRNGNLQGVYDLPPDSLAGLPVPDRSLIRRRDYAPVDVVQATRGCPYRCSFCSIAAFHQYRFRKRPVPEVVEELETLGRYILFMDDSLVGDREYAMELFSAMVPLGKRWFSQCNLGIAHDPELLGLAARSGCRGLFVGFESLSQGNLRSWRKGSNLAKDYLQTVENLHRVGIAVFAAFVFGADHDTPEVFPQTLRFLLEANVESLQATRLTPFPGTPLFQQMQEEGRIIDKDWSHYDFAHVVFAPMHMSPETLHGGVAWVLREFYGRRNVSRRIWRGLRYLSPDTILRGVAPLNLGYRHRLSVDGTFPLGSSFDGPGKEDAATGSESRWSH